MTSSTSTTPRGVLGQSTILGRLAPTSASQPAGLSAIQSQVDGLVTHFVDEAASPTTLAALMAGGIAYRFGRIGTMALGEGRLAAAPLRFLSMGVGLGTEVSAFELANRTLSQDQNPNRWHWSGQGGWAQGLTTSAITFGMLKSAGFLAREQNFALQHAFQATAMVVGHNTAGVLGITARPEGSLAEQLLHAEATNIQLGAGTGLLHTMAPGLHGLERSLDLSIRARETGAQQASPLPQLAMATAGAENGGAPLGAPYAHEGKRHPNAMMMSTKGGEGSSGEGGDSEPPSSGVRPSVPPESGSHSAVEVSFADIDETAFDTPPATTVGRSPLIPRMAQESPPPEGTANSLEQAVQQAIERHSSDNLPKPDVSSPITAGDGVTPALVVTGGSSGIGMSLVLEAAQRGYLVVYGGTRPFAELAPELQALKSALYVPVHVEDPDSMNVFRDQALFLLKGTTGPLHVLASAGISARGSQGEIDRMMGVNVGGTQNLLQSFAETLKRSGQNRFVGFGSVVAAENVPIPGDEAYQESKKKIHDLVLLMPDYQTTRGIEGFTVMPGAVDTPMLRKEAAPSFIFLNLMRELTRAGSPIRPALEAHLGIKLDGTPSDYLRRILGDTLTQSPKYKKVHAMIEKDPDLTPNKRQRLLAATMSEDPRLQAAIMNILNSLDIAVPPSFVAEKTLYQLESGRIPENQMLKVYSRSGQDWILRAFRNTEDSALPLPPPPPTRPTPRSERTTRIDRPRGDSIPPMSFAGVEQDGDQWTTTFRVPSMTAHAYASVTGNTAMPEKGMLSSAMTFVGAFPAIEQVMKGYLDRGVIHGKEEITYLRPIRAGDEISVKLRQEITGKPGKLQIVTLTRELKNIRDELVAIGTTKLMVGGDRAKAKAPTIFNARDLAPQVVIPVHPEMINYYAAVSGDTNPVHMSDAEAQARGLPGRILHGMATYNFAERALFETGVISPNQALQFKASFEGMVRPGDEVRIYVQASEKGGHKATVVNQRNEQVLTLEAKPVEEPKSSENPPSSPTSGTPPASGEPEVPTPAPDAVRGTVLGGVESGVQPAGTHQEIPAQSAEPSVSLGSPPTPLVVVSDKVTRQYGKANVEVDVSAGRAAVQRALDRISPSDLGRLVQLASERPPQPWFIAGVSDGMGFHSSVALIASGMLRSGVGVFYEPDALLRMKSAVHLGRLANVEGLRVFAEERGAAFPILYEDMVLPRWGHPEGNRTLPEGVRTTIEAARAGSQNPDLHFINSIAFARWISPEPGIERRIGVPSLDLEGRIILMDMKEYKEDNYNGTLDSMGRNHGVLLNELAPFFGPKSTSYFFTWAGGSQNWEILQGVYGGGSLGHAKEIGEADAVRFHLRSMDQKGALGSHRIVRYPDFLSFALFGIPGGGAFGLIARHVLEKHGFYRGISELAPRTFIKSFDGTHNHRNPVAQIEFDQPESTFMDEIRTNLNEFYRRVAAYKEAHPEWDSKKPLPIEASRELLRGLVSDDYVSQIPQATE